MNNEEPTIRPLSKEETTKTQILNLQEVKSTAKKETIASRTKFITTFLFVLGGLFVISGFLYTPIYNLLNKPDKKEKVTQTTNLRKTSGQITCTVKAHNEKNGTNSELSYKFIFNDQTNTIKNYIKKLIVTPATKSDKAKTTINQLSEKYKLLQEQKVNGYLLELNESKNKLEIVVTINLQTLDVQTFPEVLTQDPITLVDYQLTSQKKVILSSLENKGYKCY